MTNESPINLLQECIVNSSTTGGSQALSSSSSPSDHYQQQQRCNLQQSSSIDSFTDMLSVFSSKVEETKDILSSSAKAGVSMLSSSGSSKANAHRGLIQDFNASTKVWSVSLWS
ncbi:predicted protein [Thalassiosira pseudonana CCMP1335]|uniref:Uncharacterized protein n=1 Tax=Thalassiosira pseudonana TaxID=35128 RepID=B8C9X9_THAPS|nr:predicted protein [Thalassiosira pseudonana CCMP1335]EED89587.1 predicted protein [Thalassiosira pseudonana CCMP1335]|eukprot:scaffold1836_cov204-Alexandrium_tamarense.AAC.17